jgi:hypothetical protein
MPDTPLEVSRSAQTPHSKKLWRNALLCVSAVLCVTVLSALFVIPTLDGPNGRRRANEAATVGYLRRITALQNNYAASHPTKGFACSLPILKPMVSDADDYGLNAVLSSGEHLGYRTTLSGCEQQSNGRVTHYRITAVPLEPGKSGVWAFCTDQIGPIRYDESGSGEVCLTSGRRLN